MVIVMFQVGQQYVSLHQAANISPPAQQYVTMPMPMDSQTQWPDGFGGFENQEEEQQQQQQFKQVCFIKLQTVRQTDRQTAYNSADFYIILLLLQIIAITTRDFLPLYL